MFNKNVFTPKFTEIAETCNSEYNSRNKAFLGGYTLNKCPFQFTIFTGIQFFLLTVISIFFYPGGSWLEPKSLGYPFFRTFYSELGMTVTKGGMNNMASAVLFATALTFAGLGVAVFYLNMQYFFRQSTGLRLISSIGTAFGVLSGILYIGTALTPVNLFFWAHATFAILASQALLLAAICFALAIFKSSHYPKIYGIVYVIFTLILLGYLFVSSYGPSIETRYGFILQASYQKILVLSAISCNLIQSWGAIKHKRSLKQ